MVHVHDAMYVSMFERLLCQPRPWLYGHLHLPGGSRMLGNPHYALAAGTQAPLVGTLMEILQAVRFPDGRLLVLAAGLGRFRVARVLQTLPCSIADVALLPDEEEAEQQEAQAAQALAAAAAGGEGQGQDLPVAAAMQLVGAAAQVAAAAAAGVWHQYELADARVVSPLGVVDGEAEPDRQAFGLRLRDIANNEFLSLPYWTPGAVGDASGASSPASSISSAATGRSREEASRDLADAALAAREAAAAAAEALVQAAGGRLAPGTPGNSMLGGAGAWASCSIARINSTVERGIPWQPPSVAAPDGEERDVAGRSPTELALRLESCLWRELATVVGLRRKIHGRGWRLPEGLHCLQPPPGVDDALSEWASGIEAGGEGSSSSDEDWDDESSSSPLPRGWAHPDYPPLRRAQRLSFALANMLPAFANSEARQALLEAGSTSARLRLVVAALRQQRNRLAAVAVLKGLSS